MNKLIVLSGVPGSGKSHLSCLLKENKKDGHLYVVSSDELRNLICGDQSDLSHDDLMLKIFHSLVDVYSLDRDGIVVLDSTNLKREYRIGEIKRYKDKYDEIDLVVFKLDRETVLKQNLNRKYALPLSVVNKYYDEFEDINELDEKFFNKIFWVTNANLDEIIRNILY